MVILLLVLVLVAPTDLTHQVDRHLVLVQVALTLDHLLAQVLARHVVATAVLVRLLLHEVATVLALLHVAVAVIALADLHLQVVHVQVAEAAAEVLVEVRADKS